MVDYHINYYICYLTMKYYTKYTHFTSYSSFCKTLKTDLLNNQSNLIKNIVFIKTYNKISVIFGLSYDDYLKYFIDFMLLDKYKDFEGGVIKFNELFENCMVI